MMLDFDPNVGGFSSQPFELLWKGDRAERRHTPDYFARLADGTGVVVDVRPDDRIEPCDAEAFSVTAQACREVGWRYRRTGGPAPVLAANVRWLAGYRHARRLRQDVADALREVFTVLCGLFVGAESVGERVAVLPVLYHLMWTAVLGADLETAPLSAATTVYLAEVKR